MYYSGKEYAKMDAIVYRLLEDYGFHSFPLDIKLLVRKMGIKLVPFSSLPPSVVEKLLSSPKTETGFHSCNKSKGFPEYTIYYNDSQSEGRWRITIGHEIKHIVCNDGSDPSLMDEELAEYFGKQLNGPRCYLLYKGLLTPSPIMKATHLTSEPVAYLVESLGKRIANHGYEFFEEELEFIDYIRRTENKK